MKVSFVFILLDRTDFPCLFSARGSPPWFVSEEIIISNNDTLLMGRAHSLLTAENNKP